MSPFEIQSRISGYNLNPHLYDATQVAEIKEYADIYGIPFDNSIEGAKRAQKSSGIFSQFTSGFTEGVLGPLAFGGFSEEPVSEGQALAHSMGHLLGFALPLAGSVLTLGGSGALRLGLSAGQVASRASTAGTLGRAFNQGRRAIGYTGEVLEGAGKVLRSGSPVSIKGIGEIPIKSVPLLGADALESWTKTRLAKHGFEVAKHLNKGTGKGKALDIAFQAGHLSVASGISGLFDGENNELNNMLFGAVAGGAFGGLGNFVTMGKMIQHPNVKIRGAGMKGLWKYSKEFATANKERLFSLVGGSAFQGGMATMQGAPTATQIYEYLLGGFFGFQAQGSVAKQANEYFNKFNTAKNEDGTKKYTHEDIRNMLKKEQGFDKLEPEAQQIVKDAYLHHFGEMYDNTLSVPSAVLREAMEADLKLAIKAKSEELNKSADKLNKYELMEAKAEVADLTPRKLEQMEMRDRIVEKVYEGIVNKEKATPEIVKIANRLTDTELKEVLKGDITSLDRVVTEHFETRPFKDTQTTLKDIVIAEQTITQDQPEITSEPMIKRFVDKLQDKLIELPYKPEDVISDAITLFNKQEIKDSKNITKTLNEFMQGLTKKYKGLVIDKDMERGLGQLFNRIQQEEVRPIVTFDASTKQVQNVWYKNVLNKIIASNQPKASDEVIYQEKKLWSDNVKVYEFGEVSKKDNFGSYFTFKPYEQRLNFDYVDGASVMTKVPRMSFSDWVTVQKHLWNSKGDLAKRGKYYLKIPKKDNGVERIYPFHPDVTKTKVSQIIGEVVSKTKADKKVIESFLKMDREVWYETMGRARDKVDAQDRAFLDRLYADSFKSNYLYEKNYNFKGAVDRVKRESLLASKAFFQVNPKDFTKLTKGSDEIDVYLIDDSKGLIDGLKKTASRLVKGKKPETYYTLNKDGKIEQRAWESKIDGWIVMHSDLYKQFVKSNHLEEFTSHIKPSVAVEINGELFLVKGGVHPSRKAYDKFLKNPNSMIVVTSASKHIPKGAKVYRGQARGKTIFEVSGNQGPSLKMPLKDFRINYGVYGDSHSSQPTSIKKQMHTFLDKITMSEEGYNAFMDSILDIPLNGTPENNAYLKALKKDPNLAQPKGFDISKLSDKDFVEIINDVTHPLHKELNLEVFKKIRTMEIEEELGNASEKIQELKEYANAYETWYKASDYNPLSSVINMNLYQKAVHSYRLRRFTQPRWEFSGAGWVAGVDPIMEAFTGGLRKRASYDFWTGNKLEKQKVGHVKLGYSHKDKRIKWLDGKTTTLEKGWNEYQDAIKNKAPKETIARMRTQLMLAVMRVPASAVSGTRALLFDGFVDNDVDVADYGVYMRARDHFYIDGADVDGDKVFFYQGLPQPYMRDLSKNDGLLEKAKTVGGKTYDVLFDNKAEKFDALFGSELGIKPNKFGLTEKQYVQNNPIGQWSPGALRKAGQSSYYGKQGMGSVVNAKSFMNTVLADIIKNRKGELNLKVYSSGTYRDSKGMPKVLGRLVGKTSEKILNADDGYYVVGVEASSRTADSANYYRMADSQEMTEIIFRSAFKNLRFIPEKNAPNASAMKPKFWMLKNSLEYNQIYDLNQKLYGFNYEKNRAFSAEEVQNTLKNTVINTDYTNSIITIAHHMSKNNLDLNPLGYFNFRNLDSSIRLLGNNIWRDPIVKEFAVRKNLTIKPTYWNISYDRVYNIMNKYHPNYRTERGRALSKIDEGGLGKRDYADFIWQGLQKKLPEDVQKTFEKIYTNERADIEGFHIKPISKHHVNRERDFRLNDTWDIYSAITALETGRKLKTAMANAGLTTEGRGKNIPYKEINEIAYKKVMGEKLTEIEKNIENRFNRFVKEAVNTFKKMPEGQLDIFKTKQPREKDQNDWITFRDYIAVGAHHIKTLFRHGFANADTAVYQAQDSANQLIKKYLVDINKRSEKMGIDPTLAGDYFFSHLLGSLSPQTFSKQSRKRTLEQELKNAKTLAEKDAIKNYLDNLQKNYENTGIPKFTWELTAIPDKVKNEFLKGFANTFDVLNNKTPEEVKSVKPEFFFRKKEVVEKSQPESIPEFIESQQLKIDRLMDVEAPKIDPANVPTDITNKVIPNIKRNLKRLPVDMTLRIDDVYTLMKSEQGFTGTTSIRNATYNDLRSFERYLRDFVEQGAIKDPKGNAFYKKIYDFIFPQSVGERMSSHDLNHLYSVKVPIKNIDGSMGEASIKIPLSAMSYLQRASNSIRRFEDSISNQLQENLFNSITVKAEVEALPNGIERFQKLMEIAVKQRNAEREVASSKSDFYQNELAQSKKDIQELSGKIFRITRDGKTVQKTGEELISDIKLQLDKFFKEEMYESWVGAGFIKDGEWKKIDWNIVDNDKAWEGKGLNIHPLVRYDKFGRFDVENFYNSVTKLASEGNAIFAEMIGKRTNPLSVELLNRVQYEIALEEVLSSQKFSSDSKSAQNYRFNYRKRQRKNKETGEIEDNPTAFVGIGLVKEGYFPQMMHNKAKLEPWIKGQQDALYKQLSDFFTLLQGSGKLKNAPGEIKKRYRPTDFEIKAVLGQVPEEYRMTSKEVIDKIMAKQAQDFEIMTGKALKDQSTGEWGMEFLNSSYRDSKKDWNDSNFSMRPGTGQGRGDVPMPYFSYSPDVLKTYAEQWTSSFFKNTLALTARRTINKYELLNPVGEEAKTPWATEMRLFVKEQMGHSAIMPMNLIGLSKYQRERIKAYINKYKDSEDNGVQSTIANYQKRLKMDDVFKKEKKVKGIRYAVSDQTIIDYLDLKSQGLGRFTGKLKGFGTMEKPSLPFYGELPKSQKARERRLHEILVNTGNFEAKMSLLSLLAHPKTALGNIFGGSQNTITNAGLRNFIKANDVKWLLTHVFKDARLKDGTKITDKNTIRRWISEVGALESFYVTEASMDKSLSVTRMKPFINEMLNKLFTKDMNDTTWKEIAQKHRVWDSIVASGGYFMRTSEAKLRADAFMAHYLHARETYSQLVPDLQFNNPYLIRQALKGVEATQFLYHNVNRPAITRSTLGKVLTRFQPFAWNSVRFRRHIYKTAKRYGMTDKQSVDRLKRFMAQDLMVASLASIFVASIFDSTLPPPMAWAQSTAEWLFGDPEEREKAFFSSYPHPALAPLQLVTAPVHRYYLPVITGLINGDWDKFSSYYIHTMYPGGRLARSLYMTVQAPEMFPEFMFGIPVHRLGANMRKRQKAQEQEVEDGES